MVDSKRNSPLNLIRKQTMPIRQTPFIFSLIVFINSLACNAEEVFPGKHWETVAPEKVGLIRELLEKFSRFVGGRGCVVRDGRIVYVWGDHRRRGDVASACKPFYSHFLWKAIELEKIKSPDEKVIRWEPRLKTLNEKLGFKDRDIRWRDLANQTSCYGLRERPGTAFAYNDWQMALFWDTLFTKVYSSSFQAVDREVFHPLLTDPIQCEDSPTMMAFGTQDRPGRVSISPRDFARFGLLYLRKGRWKNRQLIKREFAVRAVTSPLPPDLPRAGKLEAGMIEGQRTIGSDVRPDNQTEHFGSYSWLWWINGTDKKGTRMFPDAPVDLFGAFGHGGRRAMWVMPQYGLIVSYNDSRLSTWVNGRENPTNQAMKLLIDSIQSDPRD